MRRSFAHARTFIDTPEALTKAGDLLRRDHGRHAARRGGAEARWAALCRGECGGRTRPDSDERTVFKAVGSALEDLTAATLVWQSSLARKGLAVDL